MRQYVIALCFMWTAVASAPVAAAATQQVWPREGALGAALARAAPGDTIVVHAGTYRVNLVIRKPLTLDGMSGAVLDGGSRGNVIRIAASNVTIRGFTIRASGTNLTDMDAGIFVDRHADNVVIRHNNLVHDLFGVWLDGCKGPQVIDNRVQGIRALRSQDRGDGIHLWNVHHGLIAGNDIAYARDGIYIYVSNHDSLRGNTIHNLRYGIHYMYSNHNRVVGNRTYNTRGGYALMESDHLVVANNVSKHDRNYGILMNYITFSDIVGNKVIAVARGEGYVTGGSNVPGAQGKALFAYNCAYDEIQGNLFAYSDVGLHLTAGSEHNRVCTNSFVNNHIQVRYGNNRPEEWSCNGRGNYWSDYLGWDLNADDIGDVPYVPNDAMDRLLWIYPMARLLINSPAVQTVRWVQNQFPVFEHPNVQDSYPLMRSPVPLPTLRR